MVSIDDIKAIILEQRNVLTGLMESENIIGRELPLSVLDLVTGVANIITGPRRSGKSIFAFQILQGTESAYINFDDERLNISAEDLNHVLEAMYQLYKTPEIIVLDEIQNVAGWEKFASRLVTNKKLIITGSNSRLMSRELATYMTGRHVNRELYPFSFREFLDYVAAPPVGSVLTTEERAMLKSNLERYLITGGFPLAIKAGKNFLLDLYRDILEHDVIQRYNINMKSKLRDLARYLISNASSEITYNRLRRILNVSGKSTIQNWISFLENSYLVVIVERFSFKLKESMIAPKKVYAVDTGIINMLTFGFEKGRIMENAVLIQLLRNRSYTGTNFEINYWKDHSGREIDFVVRKGRKVIDLINVTYASSREEIRDREIDSLVKGSEELRCTNLQIITWDYHSEENLGGKVIKFIPLWKWLLLPVQQS